VKKQRKSRRSNSKYPGLDKKLNLKIRQEIYDQDYINKLSDDEKRWLSSFNEEYINANFNHDGERIHPKKFKTKTVKATGKRRKVDIFKKDCEDRNNSRNRDSYSITKIHDMLKDESEIATELEMQRSTNHGDVEDNIIEMLDLSKKVNKD
jgi:hypothetical protein